MASTLGEDLEFLGGTVPTLPGQAAQASAGAQQYLEAVRGFVGAIEKRREEAQEMLDAITSALEALRDQSRENKEALLRAMGEAQTALEAAVEVFETSAREMKQSLAHSESVLGEVRSTAVDVAERAKTAEDGAEAKFTAFAQGLGTAEKSLTSALEEAVSATETFEKAIEAAESPLEEPVAKMEQKLSGLADGINGEIVVLGNGLFRLVGSLESEYEGPVGPLEALAEAMADEYKQLSENSVPPLSTTMDEMDEAAQAIVAGLGEAPPTWTKTREELDQAVATLEQNREPLPAAISAVRLAADETGVTFGPA